LRACFAHHRPELLRLGNGRPHRWISDDPRNRQSQRFRERLLPLLESVPPQSRGRRFGKALQRQRVIAPRAEPRCPFVDVRTEQRDALRILPPERLNEERAPQKSFQTALYLAARYDAGDVLDCPNADSNRLNVELEKSSAQAAQRGIDLETVTVKKFSRG
jgi:hypothetical protein